MIPQPASSEPWFTEAEWKALWEPIDPVAWDRSGKSLGAYCQFCDDYKRKLWQERPWMFWFTGNARYEVYIEKRLALGHVAPKHILDSVEASPYGDTPLLHRAKTYDDLEELPRKVVAAAHDSTVKPAYDGAHCPNCNSEDIESDGVFSEGDLAICFANVECHSCGATWRELFALDGFDGLEVQVPKKGE